VARIVRLDDFARRGLERPRRRDDSEAQLAIPFPARIVPLGRAGPIDLYGLEDARAAIARALSTAADADDFVDIGIGAVERGQTDAGVDAFAMALALEPAHAVAHYDLANVYLAQDLHGPARVHLGIAVAADPTFADAHFNLGLACAGAGAWGEALRAVDAYRDLVSDEDAIAEDLATQLRAALAESPG
jgi:tetratricopeptide (TPR) repeat protein